MAAWYELDGWDVVGAIAEFGTKVSASMAQYMQTLASTIQQQAGSAAQRAEIARAAWLTLDQMNTAAIAELNAIQPGQFDAQIMARVEALKSALGQNETFTQAASEARTMGQIIQSVGRNLDR